MKPDSDTEVPPRTRLVLVVPAFPKLSETFIVSKFLGLLKRGWDVHVACQQSAPAQWANFPELALDSEARKRVHVGWPHRPRWWALMNLPFVIGRCFGRNPAGTGRYLRRGFRSFGFGLLRQLYLDASLVALKPDILHFEFGALAVGRIYLKTLLDCKVTTSFRGYDLNVVGLDRFDHFREVWQEVDAIHVLGQSLWRRALERGCPPAKPHVLIPPAVDVGCFAPVDPLAAKDDMSGRPLRIVSVGRLTWEKGYDYAIQAVAILVRKGISVELRIIGDGNMLESLAFARHQLGVTHAVHFLGALPSSAVRDEIRQADVFLHGSVSEGFGNAVIEAQATGLPVVCTDVGGLPENVVDGETGFVVARRDATAIAEKLELLKSRPVLAAQMGTAGRNRVLQRFQLSDQLDAFVNFYRQVAMNAPQQFPLTSLDGVQACSANPPNEVSESVFGHLET